MHRFVGLLSLLAVAYSSTVPRATINYGNRIINGEDADIQDYPWQVSYQSPAGSHICGGVLVANQYVLTAAHCADAVLGSSVTIVAGSTHYAGTGQGVQKQTSEWIKTIEQWSPSTVSWDYAIVKLNEAFEMTDYVQAIDIAPSSVQEPTAYNCEITGWGVTTQTGGGFVSAVLQKANTTVITDQACRDAFSQIGGLNFVNEAHICTQNGETNTCNGDSGGPLICDVNNKKWLFGLTSFGIRSGSVSCSTDFPAGFAQTNNPTAVDFFNKECGGCIDFS